MSIVEAANDDPIFSTCANRYLKNGQPAPVDRRAREHAEHEGAEQVDGERAAGAGRDALDSGLMLTRDQNIVDMTYQVVWNVSNPEQFLFNLADPEGTIRAVAESAMRDIVARSELAPILNRDRGTIADTAGVKSVCVTSSARATRVVSAGLRRAAVGPARLPPE